MAAPRTMWSGTISFDLVSIPVKVVKAASSEDLSFNQLHAECGHRINVQKVCRTCETPVEDRALVKGYEHTKGQYVVLTDEDLTQLPIPAKDTIAITEFVPVEAIDPTRVDKSYFLIPDKGGAKAFALLRATLAGRQLAAVATVVFRKREDWCAIRVTPDGALALHTLFRDEELRSVPVEVLPAPSEQECKLANMIIDLKLKPTLTESPPDQYEQAVRALVEAKLAGKAVVATAAPVRAELDLEAALRASLGQ